MIKYQDQILNAYFSRLRPEEQKLFMSKFSQLDEEKKDLLLHNLATTMPEFKELIMSQEPQVEFMMGGVEKEYQQGGMMDITEMGKKSFQRDNEDVDIFFDNNGDAYTVQNGIVGERVDPNEWRSIPGGKFRRTATISNPKSQSTSQTSTNNQNSKQSKRTGSQSKPNKSNQIKASGEKVRQLQQELYDKGYLKKEGNTKNGKWDGLHGRRTEEAYQKYLTDQGKNQAKNQKLSMSAASAINPLADSLMEGNSMGDNTSFTPQDFATEDFMQPDFAAQEELRKAQEDWFYEQLKQPYNAIDYSDPSLKTPADIGIENSFSTSPNQIESGRDLAREFKESGISGVIANTLTPDVQQGSYEDRVSKSLERLYNSDVYKNASFIEKLGMQAEIDPLSFLTAGMGSALGVQGVGSLPKPKVGKSAGEHYAEYVFDRQVNPRPGRYKTSFDDTRLKLGEMLQKSIQSGKKLTNDLLERLTPSQKSQYETLFNKYNKPLADEAEAIFNNPMQKYGGLK